MNRHTMDLTKGNIWKQLILFAVPLLGSSLIQQLYNTVDLLYVGNFIGKEASASIGSSSLIVNCLVGFFTGMSVGSGVAVSKAIGAGDRERLRKHIRTAIAFCFAGGGSLMLIGWLMTPHFLTWIGVPESIFVMSAKYMRIYFLCMIPVVTYNIGSGIIRAFGDSVTPLKIQLLGGITNVIADYIFIVCLGQGVAGAGYATFFSQGIASLLTLIVLFGKKNSTETSLREIRFFGSSLKEILRVGVPSGIQSIVISLSNIIIQSRINSFGVDVMAAFSAYFKVELLIYLPILAFGQAMTTFSGQNMGAGLLSRVKKGTFSCMTLGIVYAGFMAAFILSLGGFFFGLFNRDPAVIAYGKEIIAVSFPFYWLYAIMDVLSSSMRGQGHAFGPMIITVINLCVLRTVVLLALLSRNHCLASIAVSYPISWAANALCMLLLFLLLQKKLEKQTAGKNT